MENEDYTTLSDATQGWDNNKSGDNQTRPKPSHIIYRMIGQITILFGIIVGIVLFVTILDSGQSPLFGLGRRQGLDAKQAFVGFGVSLGFSLLFVIPGVICIGVGKIIKLIEQGTMSDNLNLYSKPTNDLDHREEKNEQNQEVADESIPFQHLVALAEMDDEDDETSEKDGDKEKESWWEIGKVPIENKNLTIISADSTRERDFTPLSGLSMGLEYTSSKSAL